MFTNTSDGGIDVLYTVTEYDEDDVNLAHANDTIKGVDGEDEGGASDEDCDPEKRDDKDSEDKEDDDSDNANDDDGDDAPETEVLDDDVDVKRQSQEWIRKSRE